MAALGLHGARRTRSSCLIALSLGLACAAGDNDEGQTTFGTSVTNGSASSPVTTVSTSATTTDDPPGDADVTGSDDDDGDSDDDTADQDTGEPQSEQPPSGMYSHCLQPASCVGLTTCFTISEGMEVVDGFCTRAPCNDAATDCDASPGGTSVPICFEMMVGGTPTLGCALDCTSGKTCPAGMQCYTLADGQVCV